jgi:LuxR family maltose regulon positive regulatory protein
MEEGATEGTGFDGSEFIKAALTGNTFIIPLDASGEWFRFHHLFQDYLQRELSRQLAPAEIAALHSRASSWCERHNLTDEAIKYALEAGDADTAADIILRHRNEALSLDRWYILDTWLEKLPAETVHQRPALLLACAYSTFYAQQFMKMDVILNEVKACLSDDTNDDGLRLEIKFFEGYLYFWQANIKECKRALKAAIKGAAAQVPQLMIAESELHLGLARAMNGEQALAIEALNQRIEDTGSSTGPLLSRAIGGLAMIYLLSGSLQQLTFEARRLQNLTGQNRTLLSEFWGYYLEGAADLHAMDLDSALVNLSAACKHLYVADARAVIDAMAGVALIHQLMRRTEQAQAILQQLTHFACETNDPVHICVAHSCEARIALLRGEVAQASHWAQQHSEPVDPFAMFIWLEAPHVTRARALVADGSAESLARASELLGEIRHTAEKCHFSCQTIEIAVLLSLLLEKQGHSDAALAALEEALTMAEAGGWIRPFVELGRPMTELLERLAEHNGSTDFLRRVRETCDAMPAPTTSTAAGKRASATTVESWSGEPLTRRELGILELLTQRLQNKEIASHLSVSPETVKTHLKHLYQKLDVNNRRDAAVKAAQILESTRRNTHTMTADTE